jgi:hypothetical protein
MEEKREVDKIIATLEEDLVAAKFRALLFERAFTSAISISWVRDFLKHNVYAREACQLIEKELYGRSKRCPDAKEY